MGCGRTDHFSAPARSAYMRPSTVLTREMEEAIQDCLECHRSCWRTFSHLLTLETEARTCRTGSTEYFAGLRGCLQLLRGSDVINLRISHTGVRLVL
jgi:hypothetical protein